MSEALTKSGGVGAPANANNVTGAVRTGGSFTGVTVTKKKRLAERPPRSVAVTIMVAVPDWLVRGARLRLILNSPLIRANPDNFTLLAGNKFVLDEAACTCSMSGGVRSSAT